MPIVTISKHIFFQLLILCCSSFCLCQSCDCGAALDYTVKKIETNYAGFSDKVTETSRHDYKIFTDSLRGLAGKVKSQGDCLKIISGWLAYMEDGHVSIRLSLNSNTNTKVDSVRLQYASWPVVNFSAAGFSEYLATNAGLRPLEGIWQNEDGSYKVGIVYKDGKYTGFVIKADSVYWVPGQVKFEFAQKENKLSGVFYMRDHSAQTVLIDITSIDDGAIQIGNTGTWYKLGSNGQIVFNNYYPGCSVVSFRKLSSKTNLITIHSFNESYRKVIDSIVRANDDLIRNTENLIIDVRGNSGGSDISFYPLRKYLFTHPYMQYATEMYCTPDNIEKNRILAKAPDFTKEEQDYFLRRAKEMEKHLNEYWSSGPATYMSDTMDVLSYPLKVSVLIDQGCGSTTEQFLLDPVRNSKKVTIYGQPSAGILDYANVYWFRVPNTDFLVNYATSRSKRIDLGKGIDNKGISPDVLLDSTKDWVQFVKTEMEK